jgi:hypothetical protein
MSKSLKRFCARKAHRVSLFIYARTMRSVSHSQKRWITARLLKSSIGASDEGMISDRIHAEAEVILEQHKFNSLKMWKFCGVAVVCLARQLGLKGTSVRFSEVPVLQKRLFKTVRTAVSDADVNAKVDSFFEQMLKE